MLHVKNGGTVMLTTEPCRHELLLNIAVSHFIIST